MDLFMCILFEYNLQYLKINLIVFESQLFGDMYVRKLCVGMMMFGFEDKCDVVYVYLIDRFSEWMKSGKWVVVEELV